MHIFKILRIPPIRHGQFTMNSLNLAIKSPNMLLKEFLLRAIRAWRDSLIRTGFTIISTSEGKF